jgi:DNA-3-methyladenine glycosylase II
VNFLRDEAEMESAVAHLLESDPIMADIVRRVGPCHMPPRDPTFETLARSITFQQLHGKAAATIFGRVRKAVGRRFTAAAFLRLTPEELRTCGLSRQKIASLQDLASRVASRQISFKKLQALPDEEIIAQLSQVRGVGVWTVQMFLMFALSRPNVMPVTDFGVRNAVRKAYGLEEMPTPAEMLMISEKWHPYCSVASWYLWRSLDLTSEIVFAQE